MESEGYQIGMVFLINIVGHNQNRMGLNGKLKYNKTRVSSLGKTLPEKTGSGAKKTRP